MPSETRAKPKRAVRWGMGGVFVDGRALDSAR
jgi:hypothetical protein